MNKSLFRGSLGLMLALMLVLSALPLSALAAETENSEFTLIELTATDVTLDETIFEYTGSEIKLDGEEYKFVKQEDILAVVTN